MKKIILAAVSAAAILGTMAPASAVELPVEKAHAGYRETGASKDWVAIYAPSRGAEATRVCALYSRPTKSSVFQNGEKVEIIRGELAAFINWNEKSPSASVGEVSFILGAPVAIGDNEHHKLNVDGTKVFDLVGDGDRLYVMPKDDQGVIEAIRAGTTMTVSAELADGHVAQDDYSLFGVMATTAIASDSCK